MQTRSFRNGIAGFRRILLGASLLCTTTGTKAVAQSTLADSLDAAVLRPYASYTRLKQEVLYIHANKQAFVPGEPIAFKVYVTSLRDHTPFLETSNIYVELFCESGKRIDRQILYAEGGEASGSIALPADAEPGNYLLRAYTAWSRNFGPESTFQLPLRIVGHRVDTALYESDSTELMLVPEGGVFIENVETRFGCRLATRYGTGRSDTIRINRNGLPYDTVVTTDAGFATVAVTACVEDLFTAEWNLPGGGKRTLSFPTPLEKGVALSAIAPRPGSPLLIFLKTNSSTLRLLGEQKFFLLLHRAGRVHKLLWVSFINRKLVVQQSFAASDLPPGVMHITLFGPDMKPVADRAVYIHPAAPDGMEVAATRSGDSIWIDLKTTGLGGPAPANLSVSLLPAGTRADEFRSTLYARTHLEMDLAHPVGNSAELLSRTDSTGIETLDKTLIVSGGKRYDWNAILNGHADSVRYPFEQGFTIRGTIATGARQGRSGLILSDAAHQLFLKSETDSAGRFEFSRVYLENPARLKLMWSTPQAVRRGRSVHGDSMNYYFDDAVPSFHFSRERAIATVANEGVAEALVLRNVTVLGSRRDKFSAASDLASVTERFYKFSETERLRYRTLKEYLRGRYNVIIKETVDPKNLSTSYHVSFGQVSSINLPTDPVLIVDGMQMSDLSVIERLNMSDIESISVNTRGSNEVAFGAGGHIIVKLRSPMDTEGEADRSAVLAEWLLEGYSSAGSYSMPAYRMDVGSAGFAQYACLGWNPRVVTDSTGRAHIGFACPRPIRDITIIVEGFSPRGSIYFLRKTIDIGPGDRASPRDP
ncbi:MAG: large extracellular alpha-helical protein [Flaviaesturariibacter sp.]|nr:large extracellular alpha-helical protein [Flaviaesturariibacter sp.]